MRPRHHTERGGKVDKKPRPEELLVAIHKHCLECSGGSRKEVHRCGLRSCALWIWREPETQARPKKDKRQVCMFDLFKEAKGVETGD